MTHDALERAYQELKATSWAKAYRLYDPSRRVQHVSHEDFEQVTVDETWEHAGEEE